MPAPVVGTEGGGAEDRNGKARTSPYRMASAGTAPVKVARIIARLNIGGPAVQAILLTEGLAGPRFAPVLVTGVVGESEGDMLPQARGRDVHPLLIPELGRDISWIHDLVAFWKLVRILKELRPDVVHTHTAKAGFLGRLAAVMAGVPIRVHTFHGHVFRGYFGPIRTRLFILLERCLARITDRIIAVSPKQRDELAGTYRIGTRGKVQVIPVGFDLEPFLNAPPVGAIRRERGIPQDAFVIGFVGRLVPIKNPLLLVQAIELLNRDLGQQTGVPSPGNMVEVRVVIVGGGELDEPLRQRVREQCPGQQVMFLGWREDMAALYADMDVVVLTSNNEGTPVVLIEAMASGKPFIATDVGGVCDLMMGDGRSVADAAPGRFTVFDNGVMVKPEDAEGIAAALLYVLERKEEREQMGRAGRHMTVERFAKERLLNDISGLYEELLQVDRGETLKR